MTDFSFRAIAVVESCYKQKFAIPRQPGLAPSGRGVVRLIDEFAVPEMVDGLAASSHIWLQFVFHATRDEGWSPRVRPPRLGGNRKLGVLATRSTHRPNPIGLSVVRLDAVDCSAGVCLHVSGLDLLDGTPVLDIKPYIPYADCLPGARNAWAELPPQTQAVEFSDEAERQLESLPAERAGDLRQLIVEILQQDPRPAYQALDVQRLYGVSLLDFELKWRYQQRADKVVAQVVALAPAGDRAN